MSKEQKETKTKEQTKEQTKSKTTKEKIEELKKHKCGLPFCNEEQLMTVSLPLLVKDKDGNLIPEGDETSQIGIPVPVCKKHLMLLTKGILGVTKVGEGFAIVGPLDIIAVAEMTFDSLKHNLKEEIMQELKQEKKANPDDKV